MKAEFLYGIGYCLIVGCIGFMIGIHAKYDPMCRYVDAEYQKLIQAEGPDAAQIVINAKDSD